MWRWFLWIPIHPVIFLVAFIAAGALVEYLYEQQNPRPLGEEKSGLDLRLDGSNGTACRFAGKRSRIGREVAGYAFSRPYAGGHSHEILQHYVQQWFDIILLLTALRPLSIFPIEQMNTPESALLSFMKEMNSWEKRCALRTERSIAGTMSFDEAKAIGEAEYLEIFRRYCSLTHAVPREFHYSSPPDYDAHGEEIVDQKNLFPDIVEILTQQHYSHKKRHRYRLGNVSGEWRLLEKTILLSTGEELVTAL